MQDKKEKLENLDNQDAGLKGNKVLEIAVGIQELILSYEKHMQTQKMLREEDSPHMEFIDMVEMFRQKSTSFDQQDKDSTKLSAQGEESN